MKNGNYLLGLLILFILQSCNLNSKELIELRNEVRYLETEISSIRTSPGYYFGEAFDYLDAGDYGEAVSMLNQVKTEFPEWNSGIVNEYLAKFSELAKKDSVTVMN